MGDVDEEIVADTEIHVFLVVVIVHAHLKQRTLVVVAVVDAETEQVVVAHLPELLLLRTTFHVRRGKHALHAFHLHLIGGECPVGDKLPIELIRLTNAAQIGNVADVVGKVQLEVLSLEAEGGNCQ